MNNDIQPAITPLNLEHVIKPQKACEACREIPIARDLTVSYLAGGEGWA